MDDTEKSKEQLVLELNELRSRCSLLESRGEASASGESVFSFLENFKNEFHEKWTVLEQKDRTIEKLQLEIEKIREADRKKSEEISRLNMQEDACTSLMVFLQELGQQFDRFMEEFKTDSGDIVIRNNHSQEMESRLSARMEKSTESFSQQLSAFKESIDEISRRFEQMQFVPVDTALKEKTASHESGNDSGFSAGINELKDLVSILDLKFDSVMQHIDMLQEGMQVVFSGGNGQKESSEFSMEEISESLKVLPGLLTEVERLGEEFREKLKNDLQKDKLIDNLHEELQEYKNDILKKFMISVFSDLIQVIDNIRKLTSHYHEEGVEKDPEKLLHLLESVPSDIEDIFSWQGVKPYVLDSKVFDPGRQRILKKIETEDQEKDKTVAESMRPGYEWEGKIIRPEMVAVYVQKNTLVGTVNEEQ